jgi:MoxR-like ATPase
MRYIHNKEIIMELKEKLKALRESMEKGLIEREAPIRLVLLAALAGEHLLLVGPPGTAKSELARRLKGAFNGGHYYERQLTRFSVPEELFGPLSIKALEEDRYERLTSRYLPDATVAFVDEIFKANSAILNSLLTLLNEREFDNGHQRVKTPLVTVVGASNELPEGEELDALYDRFLLRYHVDPVSQTGFKQLLELSNDAPQKIDLKVRLTTDDLRTIREDVELVELPTGILELIGELRAFLQEQEIFVSDRRWRKVVKLLKTSAYTDGRDTVSIWDCWLLQHCLWNEPEQHELIYHWYAKKSGTGGSFNFDSVYRQVSAWEDKLNKEKDLEQQARDDDGNLLFKAGNGRKTTNNTAQAKRKGEALYLAPKGSNERNGDKHYARDELLESFSYGYSRSNQIEHDGNYIDIDSYIKDEKNHAMTELPPFMETIRYSRHHIEGRTRETRTLLDTIQAYREDINLRITSIKDEIDNHLWIAPGFSEPASISLSNISAEIVQLEERMHAIHDGFTNLPCEE